MKRRDVLKGLSLLPLSGSLLAKGQGGVGLSLDETAGWTAGDTNIFRSLGIEPLINCRGTFTIIGGSLERPAVRAAMEAASKSFVQYDELADGVGKRLAELTKAPWGMVSSGCAAGLKHVTAACVTGGNPEKLIRIPDLSELDKTEVIIPVSSRNVYDHAIRNIGVKIINVASMKEFEQAVNEKTAMIYMNSDDDGPCTLEGMAAFVKDKKIPILVDAAAEDLTIPCIHLQRGATIVAYSGGKSLCGPQCAGLLIGDKDILMSAWQASSPHHGPGRDNKVGREEMIGLLAAVEAWVTLDHQAKWKKWLGYLDVISKKLNKLDGITTKIHEPKELSNHSPVLVVSWDPAKLNLTGEELAEELGRNAPRIAIGSGGNRRKEAGTETSIDITTGQMQQGEEVIVAERIYNALAKKRQADAVTNAAASSIAGRWDLTVSFFSSTSKHSFYIEQDNHWLQGLHKGDYSEQELSGTMDGSTFKIRSVARRPGDHITYLFSGTVEGDNLKGNIYLGEYRTATFTAVRSKIKGRREEISIPGGPPLAT